MIEDLSILEIQEMMRSGELSACKLVEEALRRIDSLDRQGPRLNSVIEVNPDAHQIAEALDDERRQGHVRGLLHGIPILIKDNIDTADHMTTTAGSLALEGSIAQQDAFLVTRLRDAGVVLLGKTNLSEWANFRSSHSISAWSSRGGLTRNPYALDRSPCGSSSGSAVAVSAGLCAAAVGTETDGSIICPAQACGIVGIKPTLGLVSRSGVIPIAHSQDTAGSMARTVVDAAILLGAMTGADPRDSITLDTECKDLTDTVPFLDPDGLRGKRIGVISKSFDFNPHVKQIMEECLEVMKSSGAVMVDPVEIKTASRLSKPEHEVLYYEFKADLNTYLSGLGSEVRVHSMQEVIDFNEQNRERVMPLFGQEEMLKAQEKGPLTEARYLKALEKGRRLAREEGIDSTLRKHSLDAIVSAAGGPAWLFDFVNGDSGVGGDTSPAAVAGYPNITVPAGFIHGLPVGISFVGKAYTEPTLIGIAYAFEKARGARRKPEFLPTIEWGPVR
jgi:amidase